MLKSGILLTQSIYNNIKCHLNIKKCALTDITDYLVLIVSFIIIYNITMAEGVVGKEMTRMLTILLHDKYFMYFSK